MIHSKKRVLKLRRKEMLKNPNVVDEESEEKDESRPKVQQNSK